MNELKLPEASDDAVQSNGGKDKSSDSTIIQKVRDEIQKLPSLWIEQPTLKSLLSGMFMFNSLKSRFQHNGCRSLFETVVPYRAREYIYSVDTVISLLAPDTVLSRASNAVRNITLLDSIVDDLTGKIERSCSLESYNTLSTVLKDIKDCPIRLKDYFIGVSHEVPMAGMFMISMANYQVGSVVKLKSNLFNRNGYESDTIHCKLVYRTATIDEDKYGYIIHSTAQYYVMVCEIIEYNMYILLYTHATHDRCDLSLRRLSPGTLNVYGLYRNENDLRVSSMHWCQALPFSMVDFSVYGCVVSNGGVCVFTRELLYRRTKNEIFDAKTDVLVRRIIHADAMGCSRSYALVGIPGTGKSFIMNKIVKENKDAAILTPNWPAGGISFDFRMYLQGVINAIPNLHIYILMDDFDKYMSDDEASVKSNQELIFLFDFLHDSCPGGVDKEGKPRKTFTLIATMNNPKTLANAIIKRSERFDEVIEIGLPPPFIYGKKLNMIKDKGDRTNFDSIKFRLVYWYMRRNVITLADIGNIYAIMKTHRNKECINCTYGIRDLLYAIKFIGKNRKSASKEYAI